MSPFFQQYNDDDLIQWFRELAEKLGRTPCQRDLRESGGPSAMTYHRRFGSLGKVARLAGLESRPRGFGGRLV